MRVHTLKKAGYWLLDVFLPPQCVCCGKVETWLCESCSETLAPIEGPVCEQCGTITESSHVCARCRVTPLSVSPIRAVYLFDHEIRDAIHALKYRGAQSLSSVLGARMADYWRLSKLDTDIFMPVPLHPKRYAQRGYNQSWLLAREVATDLSIPISRDNLQRCRNTASQTHLSQSERMLNVIDAFVCTNPQEIEGKSVTLIDDVATTGSTLNACAVELLNKGALQVNALTLARAR